MSDITDFFIKNGEDNNGRMLLNILSWNDNKLDAVHNCIQWMFPLYERSLHYLDSTILDDDDIEIIKNSDVAKRNIKLIFERMCKFFGICDFEDTRKHKMWCYSGNHNMLRITRIIRSLRLFGLDKEAKRFYDAVLDIATSEGNRVSKNTLDYWNDALNGNLKDSMTKRFLRETH